MGNFGRSIPAVVLSIVIAACQSTPPVSQPPATLEAVATDSSLPVPSPTATPDVVDLFAGQADSLESGTLTYEGTATIGLSQLGISGQSTFARASYKRQMTTTVAGVDSVVEITQLGGLRYVKTAGNPWLKAPDDPGGARGDLSITLAGAASGPVTDTGTEERAGQSVHKLVPAVSPSFDPVVVAPTLKGAEGVTASVVFYVTEDGAPVAASFEASWSQPVDGAPIDASLALEVEFNRLGIDPWMPVPDHVWSAYTSSRWNYRVAYQDGFIYEQAKKYDYFNSPIYGNAYVYRESAQGFALNAWTKVEGPNLKDYFNTKEVTSEAITIGGVKGRLFTVSGRNKTFTTKTTLYEVVVVKGKYVFFIGWFFKAGNEAADLVTFRQMIATFAFNP